MALTDILAKIDKEALARVQELQQEFAEKKAQLEKDADEKQKKAEAEMTIHMTTDSEKIKENARIEAEMEAKNQLLKAKREVIDETLKKTVDRLAGADNYEDILVEMLKSSAIEDAAQVIPAEGKEEATRSAIQKSGKRFALASSSAKIAGGFILKADKMEIDNSFETVILEELKGSLEIELNKLMF
ncbi:V-type ATP synthase subunit E [Patescibacteria group bacterium]|nr:V-type ATP synthase subunit E [Patescibacteria group bacterium]MBU1702884.1 V-type ATP synthase subunit E [Patescibacteria group bacterium]MBU1953359.1 V-type ATP synthase subunit E [Patescibacteria group bacterium]